MFRSLFAASERPVASGSGPAITAPAATSSPSGEPQRTCDTCGQVVSQDWVFTQQALRKTAYFRIDGPLNEGLKAMGFATGGGLGGFYGWHAVMPRMQRLMPGRGLLQLWLGVPLTAVISVASAGFGYSAVPLFVRTLYQSFYLTSRLVQGVGKDLGLETEVKVTPTAQHSHAHGSTGSKVQSS